MTKYEIMFIVRPTLDEETIKKTSEDLQKLINKKPSKVIEFKEMGRKKLAYPIKKNEEGLYMLINFEAKPELVSELERVYRITDEILKFIVVRKEN